MRRISKIFHKLAVLWRSAALKRQLITYKTSDSLNVYLSFLRDNKIELPLNEGYFRKVLFGMKDWQASTDQELYEKFLFEPVEKYLFKRCQLDHKMEWLGWIRLCSLASRKIEVTSPQTATALRDAQTQGLFSGMDEISRRYLLSQYRDAYSAVLDNPNSPEDSDLLPMLLSYVSILHEIGTDESAIKVLQRWGKSLKVRPRSLSSVSIEESLKYPECGVGSPHRIGVTIYHDPMGGVPVRITGAGTTADTTLTTSVFTNIFAAALACDAEPTLITTVGWSLVIRNQGFSDTDQKSGGLFSAVLTANGPAEPNFDTPTLGMTPEESLSIIENSFHRLQEKTGLIREMRWKTTDADRVEQRIRAALADAGQIVQDIQCERWHSECSSVIHVMPLLYRVNGQVIPMEIEIPYKMLDPKAIVELLREGRSTYMNQLIAAAHSRERYAHNAWNEQVKMLNWWGELSHTEKDNICKLHPTVTITGEYNWDLGIDVSLPEPKEVERLIYEEEYRPEIRDSAKQSENKFALIAKKLEDMNQPGGKADIITFKLLIDSMIRQASLPIPDIAFQEKYSNWLKEKSWLIWKIVELWAIDNGINPETLAADNICYNALLNVRNDSVYLQPMVLIDLHDFIVKIDGEKGRMKVLSAGKTPTLEECFVPNAEVDIYTPFDLHKYFVHWIKEWLPNEEIKEREIQGLKSEIMVDDKVGLRIRLTQAKNALFHGKIDEALSLIADLRKFDLAPVYFWGAVAEQYKNLSYIPRDGLPSAPDERHEKLLNLAVAILIDSLKTNSGSSAYGSSVGYGAYGNSMIQITYPKMSHNSIYPDKVDGKVVISQRAKDYLNQLRACEKSFVQSLIHDEPNIYQLISKLEEQSFNFSEQDQMKYYAGVSAISAFELLGLAQDIKDMAKSLPYTGILLPDMKTKIRELIARKNSLTMAQTRSSLELEDLNTML